jgi:hypothetical protein
MMTLLSESKPIAKKKHSCDACYWLEDYIPDLMDQLTFQEKRSIVRAYRWQKRKILPGQRYVKQVLKGDDFCVYKAIPEIDEICFKYDLFND